jgi:P4 family phage/plasmid primase-like protien
MNVPVYYSRGESKFDNCPEQREAESFADFRDAFLADRAKAKHLTYVCGPCAPAPDDERHRSKPQNGQGASVVGMPYRSAATAQPRRFLGLDIDYMRDPETMEALNAYMQGFNAFGYTTFSHKGDAPRMRWIVELDRALDRADCIAATAVFRHRILIALGAERFTKPNGGDGFDASLDRPEQPIYTPGTKAAVFLANGVAAIADGLLADIPAKVAEYLPLQPVREVPAADDAAVIERAESDPSTGDKFAALWAGDISDYESPSHADMALMGMLWNASGNGDQVLNLFRTCALYRPDKERKSRDYYAATLNKAMKQPAKIARIEFEAADPCTDKANAIRIAVHLGQDLRFIGGMGWALFDGNRWDIGVQAGLPAMGYVTQHLDHIVRNEAVALANHERLHDVPEKKQRSAHLFKYAKHSGDLVGITRAMRLAESKLFVPAVAMDADPWLLGCANGVLDLRTGELLPSHPDQLISKTTGIAYDPRAKAPIWEAFLKRIFRQHDDLPAFMQTLTGYWLTGLTDPALLAVLYGVGGNGKSRMVEAIQSVMGDYAATAPQKLLMMRYGNQHSTELTTLQGRRFVVANESSEGGRLDEEKIKALTGSDRITARRMYQDDFTFKPTHKLALLTNHKPVVRNTDDGIWRRLLLIPFDEVIRRRNKTPISARSF